MVKVAFWFDAPIEYSGGLNYIKNLLHALSLVNDGSVQPIVFFAADLPESVEQQFIQYAKVVRTKVLQRRTLPWLAHKVLYKAFHSMAVVNSLLKSHGIDIVSHAWFVYKGQPPFRIISWIPDFQYLHLPEMFPNLDSDSETEVNRQIIAQSQAVILSSKDAFEDFKRIAPPGHYERGAVLPFVSQPGSAAALASLSMDAIQGKYGFRGRYFLLPNQFWAHKNHMVVLKAVNELRHMGIEVQVLCTGNTKDYRLEGTPYVDNLRAYIAEHGLTEQVRILGMIDYSELLLLMRHAVAVINPSRFEGWSSSVEEAKSMGRPVVLSRIGVHIEQMPPRGHYFDPDDVPALAAILSQVWSADDGSANPEAERYAQQSLRERTLEFGRSYLGLLQAVAQRNQVGAVSQQ
ncbi:glycosyltransferase [Rhizobacter sp. AJA081-3]|uniref:glycosyltransferase n=1 Tax=Rhizobacter sp. AJA081-3 TaxID=2753607 RepID=UPI001ADFC30B|nr:glycosyltransferase [Rhizobacter sp. AJA081-3]QTN24258.1 glycosyltransferase [Rhizobacter sp. AJA081-3]